MLGTRAIMSERDGSWGCDLPRIPPREQPLPLGMLFFREFLMRPENLMPVESILLAQGTNFELKGHDLILWAEMPWRCLGVFMYTQP